MKARMVAPYDTKALAKYDCHALGVVASRKAIGKTAVPRRSSSTARGREAVPEAGEQRVGRQLQDQVAQLRQVPLELVDAALDVTRGLARDAHVALDAQVLVEDLANVDRLVPAQSGKE